MFEINLNDKPKVLLSMKKILFLSYLFFTGIFVLSAQVVSSYELKADKVIFSLPNGELHIIPLRENCVRVQYREQQFRELPEWIYVDCPTPKFSVKDHDEKFRVRMPKIMLEIEKKSGKISYYTTSGKLFLKEADRYLEESLVQDERTYRAEQQFFTPSDEFLYGLGQFQDGFLNLRGLSRRLTQVNTQISIPFILSSNGYGLLWNNYGLTEFNPAEDFVVLQRKNRVGDKEAVDVTSTEGGKREIREMSVYMAQLNLSQSGTYAIMLDVGKKMARKHHLEIDGKSIFDMTNVWLPPTTSSLVYLEAGQHTLRAELSDKDNPRIYYKLVDDKTVFRSPVSSCVDYTVFAGTPDEVIAAYRETTGRIPLMPDWALGYIHCRERFHSQQEILETASRFRAEKYPLDLIVQDWQYWGKYGWNSMCFDEDNYPEPRQLVDSLHHKNMRFMLSVWSKIDKNTEVGRQMSLRGYYIPNTTWVDFFNPDAAAFYWKNFSERLLLPYGIDAWWQDATEPENDDLKRRKVQNMTVPGEVYRNVYPLLVNKTVYEGSRRDMPQKRTMILTRSGFPGMQRYGAATWSGDVGNDWETFRRQIVAGLGMAASGFTWWTYDAGGFFRPKYQYVDTLYHECFLRWLQTSLFLPLMRVHGYKSNTEFWNYGAEVERIAHEVLSARYRLFPYIYTLNAAASFKHATVMRPLVMDFLGDSVAMSLKYEYMFGPSLLVAPIVEPAIDECLVYFPQSEGWYDLWTGEYVTDGGWKQIRVSKDHIPAFVKAGTILPLVSPDVQYVQEAKNSYLEIRVYEGADGEYILYEDEGINYNYEKGLYSLVRFTWNDRKKQLVIHEREGAFPGMQEKREIRIVRVNASQGACFNTVLCQKKVVYTGKKMCIKL